MNILLKFTKEDVESDTVLCKIKEKFNLDENSILEINLDSHIYGLYANELNDLFIDTVLKKGE